MNKTLARGKTPHSSTSEEKKPRLKNAPASEPLLKGKNGQYSINEEIGKGGYANVYRAKKKKFEGDITNAQEGEVALKIAQDDGDMLKKFNLSLEREGKALNKCKHPNIVEVIDEGIEEGTGRRFLVLEYVDGTTLREELGDAGMLPWERAKPILEQVCHALAAVHAEDLVHRDIKFENIMLTVQNGEETVKLLDFGLTVESGFKEEPGLVTGSIHYIAPEQITGDALSARTDIYALGSLMYKMLCGAFPFENRSATKVIMKHLNVAPKPPSKKNPSLDIPKGLEDIVMRALEKKPEKRFQSMEEMANAISNEAISKNHFSHFSIKGVWDAISKYFNSMVILKPIRAVWNAISSYVHQYFNPADLMKHPHSTDF